MQLLYERNEGENTCNLSKRLPPIISMEWNISWIKNVFLRKVIDKSLWIKHWHATNKKNWTVVYKKHYKALKQKKSWITLLTDWSGNTRVLLVRYLWE